MCVVMCRSPLPSFLQTPHAAKLDNQTQPAIAYLISAPIHNPQRLSRAYLRERRVRLYGCNSFVCRRSTAIMYLVEAILDPICWVRTCSSFASLWQYQIIITGASRYLILFGAVCPARSSSSFGVHQRMGSERQPREDPLPPVESQN